ncbi:MAG: heat-inducible transcription repressor HrcA [Oscillospiraceae bacterium]|nr:heat-inducible transcription repressor HrcA [Oscillospiraceae bacterium]
MDMSERKRSILRAVIELYIKTAEPVGSKTLVQMPDFHVSSATLRNEMAELEIMGYLEHPHTSAGRVPTAQGYRFYVNELMNAYRLSVEEAERVRLAFQEKMAELGNMITKAGRMLSQMTQFPVYTMSSSTKAVPTVKRFELIPVDAYSFIIVIMTNTDVVKNRLVRLPFPQHPEGIRGLAVLLNRYFTDLPAKDFSEEAVERCAAAAGGAGALIAIVLEFARQVLDAQTDRGFYLTGTSNILNYPEYQDVNKARALMDFLTEENSGKLPEPDERDNVNIIIGPENVEKELRDSSVIVVSYDIGEGQKGVLGVVGPTRMDYAKVAARLSYIAQGLKRMLQGEALPPFEP